MFLLPFTEDNTRHLDLAFMSNKKTTRPFVHLTVTQLGGTQCLNTNNIMVLEDFQEHLAAFSIEEIVSAGPVIPPLLPN